MVPNKNTEVSVYTIYQFHPLIMVNGSKFAWSQESVESSGWRKNDIVDNRMFDHIQLYLC